jgi:hypothetical protein
MKRIISYSQVAQTTCCLGARSAQEADFELTNYSGMPLTSWQLPVACGHPDNELSGPRDYRRINE